MDSKHENVQRAMFYYVDFCVHRIMQVLPDLNHQRELEKILRAR